LPPRKLISLLIVALAASLSPPLASADSGRLSGAGSTLVAPLVTQWAQAFRVFYGASVSYNSAGSQAAISDVSARVVDFGATDYPMTSAQGAECRSCYQIPWALSAVGVGYHVRGIGGSLHLTGRVLAEIYLGQISRWNDRQIKALNPKIRLPALKITPIYSSTSGDTYAFTQYLSDVSRSWRTRVGRGIGVSFPTGISETSELGVITLLHSTNGSIGYVGVSYLLTHGLPAAAIQNSAGHYEYPNLANIESAGKSVKHVPSSNALNVVDPPRGARIAYPISTFTYVLVASNASQKSLLSQWIRYAIGGGHVFEPALDFAPLPRVVLRASKATVTRFAR
jgi:phosphate transport system substrate-binding protein